MYGVIDMDRFIAFHDEKSVVKKYIRRIRDSSGKRLHYVKIKRKKAEKIKNYLDLYLVRYGETYIQSGYVEAMETADPQVVYDHRYARDVIMRILEVSDMLTNNDVKVLGKAIKIIDRLIDDEKDYTPSLEDLERMQDQYEKYKREFGGGWE